MSSVTADGSWVRRPPRSPTTMSSLGPPTCGRSGRRPQLHCGYARRNVHARLRLHGHRLQGDGAVRASDQDVGTHSGADRATGGGTHIGSRQRRPAQRGRRKNRPSKLAAGRGADVEAKRADGALISLARPASRLCKDAAQLPLSRDKRPTPGDTLQVSVPTQATTSVPWARWRGEEPLSVACDMFDQPWPAPIIEWQAGQRFRASASAYPRA
jgi:hypothetical protein